jgi:glucose-6-phosphate isomerase
MLCRVQGATGLPLTNVVSIGIGGSYLGPEFVYEALRKGTCGAHCLFVACPGNSSLLKSKSKCTIN